MKFVLLAISCAVLASGLGTLGWVLYTASIQGYVVLPTRFRGDFDVYAASHPVFFAVMLVVWLLSGLLLTWLGWKGLSQR